MAETLNAYFNSVFTREYFSSLLVPEAMFEGYSQTILDN